MADRPYSGFSRTSERTTRLNWTTTRIWYVDVWELKLSFRPLRRRIIKLNKNETHNEWIMIMLLEHHPYFVQRGSRDSGYRRPCSSGVWSASRVGRRPSFFSARRTPEKMFVFRHRRRIEIFCHPFSIRQRPNASLSDPWQAPATYHRPSCELYDPRVGRSP